METKAGDAGEMIFEWRSYRAAPGEAQSYLELFRTLGVPLVTRHLPMMGYWLSDVGGLNEIHHLWAYASFAERSACRTGLAGETAWQSAFIAPAFKSIRSQSSRVLKLERSSTAFDALVERRRAQHPARPGTEPLFGAAWNVLVEQDAQATGHDDTTLAQFRTLLGADTGARLSLLQINDLDGWLSGAQGLHAAPGTSTLLRPLLLSPIGGTPEAPQ